MQPYKEHDEGLSLDVIHEIANNPSQEWKVYLAAIEYIKAGYYVIPLVKDGKRLPRREYNISYGQSSRNKKIIDKWFNPDKGQFAGWNIGISCGREDGVFAIDIDMHGDANGFDNLHRLEEENEDLPKCPIQETPNGGKHYLFKWQENAACTTNKIAPAIDTRGGTDNACKGHIVAWPSTIDGKKYNWVQGGDVPDIPPWVMDRMGVMWKPSRYGRGNENVGDEDCEKILPVEQITRMLSHINVNDLDYDSWLKVGMAIKSQYTDDEGLQIWDSWSKSGLRYKDNECKIRWGGFSLEGSVRAGTLFYYAKEGGWNPDPIAKDVTGNKFDELIARMNEEYAIVSVGGKIKVLREKEVEDAIMMHYDLLDKDSFKTLLQNEITFIEGKKGEPKPISVADIWLGHEYRRTYPNGMGLFPGVAPKGYYNTWNGFAVSPRKGDCSMFVSHIKEIICGGNEDHYNWTMDWLADMVQYPDNPKGCAIVLRGGEGIGKGTFANTIGSLFGPHYRHLIDDSHLTSNFNAHLLDALVVFADEITWGGNKKTAGKLKGMVTEQNLVGERKGVDAILYRNMIHMIIASNSEWVVPSGADSRRWFVLDVSNAKANNVNYFNSINDELNNGGKEALLYILKNRKIKVNLRHAPETKALQEQRILSSQQDSLLNWWVRCIESETIDVPDEKELEPGKYIDNRWPEQVDKVSLHDEYCRWCRENNQRAMTFNLFAKDMLNKMCVSSARIVTPGGRKRVFKIPTTEEARKIVNARYNGIITEDDDDLEIRD